jgi:hypothetical protein
VDPEHKMARQELEHMGMLKEKKGLAALFSKGIFGKKK